uniref:Uncharacterized protein n=1 Tax=Sander lucioperca TaxID=283035 RepID=A0A8C9YLY8_SANLU
MQHLTAHILHCSFQKENITRFLAATQWSFIKFTPLSADNTDLQSSIHLFINSFKIRFKCCSSYFRAKCIISSIQTLLSLMKCQTDLKTITMETHSA